MKSAYSYTVLRYIHDITTGEFVNVGVVLYAPGENYASALCRQTYERLTHIFPGLDGEAFKRQMRLVQSRLQALGDRLVGELSFHPKPKDVISLAHDVFPADDSSLQWSPAGSGLTSDPAKTLEQLFQRLVTRYDARPTNERRTDEDVWRTYKRALESRHVLRHLQPKNIAVPDDEVIFAHAWKNGVWHCLEPLSLDYTSAEGIRNKAHRFLGSIHSIRDAGEKFKIYLLLGRPSRDDLRPAFNKAVSILRKLPVENELIQDEEAEVFSERLANQITSQTGIS